jgi:hypothetical protein
VLAPSVIVSAPAGAAGWDYRYALPTLNFGTVVLFSMRSPHAAPQPVPGLGTKTVTVSEPAAAARLGPGEILRVSVGWLCPATIDCAFSPPGAYGEVTVTSPTTCWNWTTVGVTSGCAVTVAAEPRVPGSYVSTITYFLTNGVTLIVPITVAALAPR